MAHVSLAKPIPVEVCRAYLRDKREGWHDWDPFNIVGIESYEGELATVVIESPDGGVFFDIPLSALRVPGSNVRYEDGPGDLVYCPSPAGAIETKDLGLGEVVQVFTRDREFDALGFYHTSITWVDGNVLLNLVDVGGRFKLWPPHKLKWRDTLDITPLPNWLKRRYMSDPCRGLVTPNTWVEWDEDPEHWRGIAQWALKTDEGWRMHGIGVAQKYVDEDVRVHVWHPDLSLIGIEGGIHDHRWELTSHVVYGSLIQEEWLHTPDENGFWVKWLHGNQGDRSITCTEELFSLRPVTAIIHPGQVYNFPRGCYHRSTIDMEMAITVVERSDRSGQSSAMIPAGVVPQNGLDVTPGEPVLQRVLARARHLLG